MQELARPIPTVLASLGPWFKFQMPMSSCMILNVGHFTWVAEPPFPHLAKCAEYLGPPTKSMPKTHFLPSFPPTIIKISPYQASPGDTPPPTKCPCVTT